MCDDTDKIRLFHVTHQESSVDMPNEPLKITKSLIVMPDHTWLVFVNGLTAQQSCSSLHDIPEVLQAAMFALVIGMLTSSHCVRVKRVNSYQLKKNSLPFLMKLITKQFAMHHVNF